MKRYLTAFLLVLLSEAALAQTGGVAPLPETYPHSVPDPYPRSEWVRYPSSQWVRYPHSDTVDAQARTSLVESLSKNQSEVSSAIETYRPPPASTPMQRQAQNKDLMFLGNSCGC